MAKTRPGRRLRDRWAAHALSSSRTKAQEESVPPGDAGVPEFQDGVVLGLGAPCSRRIQFCASRDRRGARERPSLLLPSPGWCVTLARELSSSELSSGSTPPAPAKCPRIFLAQASCPVASSQQGDSRNRDGNLQGRVRLPTGPLWRVGQGQRPRPGPRGRRHAMASWVIVPFPHAWRVTTHAASTAVLELSTPTLTPRTGARAL